MSRPLWLTVYKGTENSPIVEMTIKFRAEPGCEKEYARKIVRALAPAIEIDSGPWPMDLIPGYDPKPEASDE